MAPLFRTIGKPRRTVLKDKDRKWVRESILIQYPKLSRGQLDILLPATRKDGELTCLEVKIPADKGEREKIYLSAEGNPVFFTFSGLGYVPTCYALDVAPQILRRVRIYDRVGDKIVKGYDLALPSVVRPPDLTVLMNEMGDKWPEAIFDGGCWAKGDMCMMVSELQWAPCGVGRFIMNMPEVGQSRCLEGILAKTLHFRGDELWMMGTMTDPNPDYPEEAEVAALEYQEREEKKAQRLEVLREMKKKKEAAASVVAAQEKGGQKVAPHDDSNTKDLEIEEGVGDGEQDKYLKKLKKVHMALSRTYNVLLELQKRKDVGDAMSDELAAKLIKKDEVKKKLNDVEQHINELEFRRSFFAVLQDEDLPVLASVVFAKAIVQYGVSIRRTSWNAKAFLDLYSNCITVDEVEEDIFNIVDFNPEEARCSG
eukprot:238879_1